MPREFSRLKFMEEKTEIFLRNRDKIEELREELIAWQQVYGDTIDLLHQNP
jgi:hypothetical protein